MKSEDFREKKNRRQRELYSQNKEAINVRRRELYNQNKEQLNERKRELYALKKSDPNYKRKVNYEANKRWKEKNKEHVRRYALKYYYGNHEKICEQRRNRRIENRDKVNTTRRQKYAETRAIELKEHEQRLAKQVTINCIKCNKPFLSFNKRFNRKCPDCKYKEQRSRTQTKPSRKGL